MKKLLSILFLFTSLLLSGQQGTIQIGTNVLNKGAKGGAANISVDTSEFTNNLTVADSTVQKALNRLDALNLGGGGATNAENVIVSPSIGGNTDAYAVMDDHEDRISFLENASMSEVFSRQVLKVIDASSHTGWINTIEGITGAATSTSNFNIKFDPINEERAFRIDVIFTVLKKDIPDFKIKILREGVSWQGENILEVYDEKLTINKSHTSYQSISEIPSNSTFQFSIIGNGSRITKSVMPLTTPWNGTEASGFEPVFVGQAIIEGFDNDFNPSGEALMFEGLDTIDISGVGTEEVVINSVNVAYMDDLDTYNHKDWIATVMEVKVLNDALDGIFPAYLFAPVGSKDLLQFHHPNGTDAYLTGQPEFWSKFYNSGYAITFGTFNSFNNPTGTNLWGAGVTSSNWGAPTGMTYRKSLMDYVDKLLKPKSHLHVGLSMGGYNALAYASIYPNKVKGVISISGALDLETNFSSGTFNNIIRAAYGSAYRNIQGGLGNPTSDSDYWEKVADVAKRPSLDEFNNPFRDVYNNSYSYTIGDVAFEPFTGNIEDLDSYNIYKTTGALSKIPIKLIHGDSDVLIDDSQSSDFKTIIDNKGGDVDLDIVTGADHLDSSLFDYNLYIKNWLKGL